MRAMRAMRAMTCRRLGAGGSAESLARCPGVPQRGCRNGPTRCWRRWARRLCRATARTAAPPAWRLSGARRERGARPPGPQRPQRSRRRGWPSWARPWPTTSTGRLLMEATRALAPSGWPPKGAGRRPRSGSKDWTLPGALLIARRPERGEAAKPERAAREAGREAVAEQPGAPEGAVGPDAEALRRLREAIYGLPGSTGRWRWSRRSLIRSISSWADV